VVKEKLAIVAETVVPEIIYVALAPVKKQLNCNTYPNARKIIKKKDALASFFIT
jgi:hypothetical protein